jgi:(5-formylfuran-3-yl)methyl phosphate synthase
MNNALAPVELLVSVRSVSEARSALEGGAALIDVKEPSRGSLGRADAEVIRAIVALVGGRRPVSAALGEWAEGVEPMIDSDLSYIKWGLASCRRRSDWRAHLDQALGRRQRPHLVLAAYADWECAQAPPIEEVFTLAALHPGSVMLLDTHCKEANNAIAKRRPTLLDWLPLAWIEDLVARCRAADVKIALAGSLGVPEIRVLLPVRPNWIAVRGAACAKGDRQATVQAEKVRELVEMLNAPVPNANSVS